jgi:hypothetical protein
LNHSHTHIRALFTLLLVSTAGLLCTLWVRGEDARLGATLFLPRLQYNHWAVIEADEVDEGASIAADTNVIFHTPLDMPPIARETLFGNRGTEVRYWGYCYPDKNDPENPPQSQGFPGRLFLSEAERAVREQLAQNQLPRYSVVHPPTRADLERDQETLNTHGDVRHQIEMFNPGQTCYIMTSAPLPIGTDRDDDGLNSQLEKQYGTDPLNPDTDGDGLTDGVEVFDLHTDPLNPDTDGDGLPDGVETHGHSQVQPGDTDPLKADSDHDGLCDGYCMVDKNRSYCTPETYMRCADTQNRWAGEDKNLDGKVDSGETDPLKWDSADDGALDSAHYYNCLLQGKNDFGLSSDGKSYGCL